VVPQVGLSFVVVAVNSPVEVEVIPGIELLPTWRTPRTERATGFASARPSKKDAVKMVYKHEVSKFSIEWLINYSHPWYMHG
jgi:hypothetical protein